MVADAPPASQQTDSLVKRLAGPSTGKAGLTNDQSEINRIIAETSKGSKFYDNEKRKDKDLTAKIEKILKERDDYLKSADINRLEASVDRMLDDLEAERDLSQIIVHVDMDAFFASVEVLLNPDLKGKPFGVGGGVLSTASYEARKFGVRSGMAMFVAKKLCPELIVVKSSFSAYSEKSEQIMDIFRRYDPDMYPAGCDEAYLNITAYCEEHHLCPGECVQEIRQKVFEETDLTVSAGIAPNTMLAKICSEQNKPNGQFHLPFDSQAIKDFTRGLSIRKIPGIGRVSERLLDSIDIKTCGDIYTHRATLSLMDKQFSVQFLLQTYLGLGNNVVRPRDRSERKSIGAERTFATLASKEKILDKLQEVAEELERDMDEEGWTGHTVTLKWKLDTFQVFNRAKTFDRWITTKEELFNTGKELLLPEFPLRIRLIGLRLTKLKDLRAPSPSHGIKRFFRPLSEDGSKKRRRIGSEMDQPDRYNGRDDSLRASDEEDEIIILEDEEITRMLPESRPRPPVSAPARSQGNDEDVNRSSVSDRKPRSTIASTSSGLGSVTLKTKQTCPICAKTFNTDNQGLNAHIDFCLSRGEIMKLQGEASTSSVSSPSTKSKPMKKGWFQKNKRQ